MTTIEPTPDLLGVADAAALLGVSPATVRRACDAGVLPCLRSPGGHRRLDRRDLDGIVREQLLSARRDGRDSTLRTLVELGEVASRAEDLDQLLREAAGLLLGATGAVTCDIYKLRDSGVFTSLVSRDRDGFDESAVGHVLRTEVYGTVRESLRQQSLVVVTGRDDPRLSADDLETWDEYGFACEIAAPLTVGDRVVGVVELYGDHPRALDGCEELVRGATLIVAGALEKGLLLEQLRARNRVLRELVDLAGLLTQTYDVDKLLQVVASRLLTAVDAKQCEIYGRDPSGYRCIVSVDRDDPGHTVRVRGHVLELADNPSIVGALAEKRTVAIPEVAASGLTRREKDVLLEQGLLSELCIPLVSKDERVGFIDILDCRSRDWQECLDFSGGVGQLVAGALESADLLSTLEGRNRELELLNEIARSTTSSLDLAEIADSAVTGLTRLAPVDTYDLALREGGRLRIVHGSRPRSAAAMTGPLHPSQMEDYVRQLKRERVLVLEPLDGVAAAEGEPAGGLASTAAIGLFDHDEVIGVLMLGSRTAHAFAGVGEGVLERVGAHLSLAANNAALYDEIKNLHLSNLKGLSTALNAKDYYTLGHAARVAAYMALLGEELGWEAEFARQVREAAYLHDIGKIGVSDRVLLKQGPLNAEEWDLMRQHPVVSAEIIRPLFPATLVAAVRHHHEHYDGTGYPDGLVAESIFEVARAMCVADSYDAMSLQRPYKAALTATECLAELERCRGTHFDPKMVDAFLRVLERLARLRQVAFAAAAEAAARIDPVVHARLHAGSRVDSEEYRQVQAALREVRDAHPEVRYMTTEARRDERVIILADGEETGSPEFSPPGEDVVADDAVKLVLAGGEIQSNVLFVDNFGVWVNGIAPLVGEDGEILAVVVADCPALAGAQGIKRLDADTPVDTLQAAAVRLSRAEIDSITDGLTGLYNHRYLHERLAEELGQARRDGSSLSLLFCDLDFFKEYNDRYGHAAGDIALRSTARLIESCTRRADLVARYGGEEFVVVLPATAADEAVEIAGRVRAAVAAANAGHGGLTISIGVATFPEAAETKERLLEVADRALYIAKRSGRDRVVAHRDAAA